MFLSKSMVERFSGKIILYSGRMPQLLVLDLVLSSEMRRRFVMDRSGENRLDTKYLDVVIRINGKVAKRFRIRVREPRE